MLQKKTFFYVLILHLIILALIVLVTLKYKIELINFIGERTFLTFHTNDLAIKFLEFPERKNDKTFSLLGRIYFIKGDLAKSVQQYDKAIEMNPNIKEYYYGRGLAYAFASKKLLPNATYDFEKYIEMDNQDYVDTGKHAYGAWAGYNDLAWSYYLLRDFKKAEETVLNGLKISGSNAWLLNMHGAILIEEERCNEATPKLEKALELIRSTTVDKYGEAYSGDNPNTWSRSKGNMENIISDNLETCRKDLSTKE